MITVSASSALVGISTRISEHDAPAGSDDPFQDLKPSLRTVLDLILWGPGICITEDSGWGTFSTGLSDHARFFILDGSKTISVRLTKKS